MLMFAFAMASNAFAIVPGRSWPRSMARSLPVVCMLRCTSFPQVLAPRRRDGCYSRLLAAPTYRRGVTSLPPGQYVLGEFPRFGTHVGVCPVVPDPYVLRVGGDVETPCEIDPAELATLPRVEQVSDFHCVATWSRLGLRWSGVRFADAYDRLIAPRPRPPARARHLLFRRFH